MNAIIDVNGEKIDFSRLNCVTFFPAEGDEIFHIIFNLFFSL